MKLKLNLLAGAVIAGVVPFSIWAQPAPTVLDPVIVTAPKTPLGPETSFDEYKNIEIKNYQDASLGRITDLSIDLTSGRIIGVLVVSDKSLDVDGKVVAVPPLALYPDLVNKIYRLNASTEVFKAAPAIDLSNWVEEGQSDRVAAYYRHFGQEPYFLEEGDTASPTAERPKVPFGYVERANKILDLPVGNLQDEKLGKVWALTMDICQGRIRNVVVIAPGNFKTKSIIPAMALSFNAKRDGLLLDATKTEFANEPAYVFTAEAFGQDDYSKRESYKGPRTSVALEQGKSYRDLDRTVAINKGIRAAKIDSQNVEVGTLNDRVTLRGWVNSNEDKTSIGKIAIAASRPELVDNQIVVGKPVTSN